MTADDDDIVRRLRDAYTELRTLPLGGRGHLADVCHEAAGNITELRARVEQLDAALTCDVRELRDEVEQLRELALGVQLAHGEVERLRATVEVLTAALRRARRWLLAAQAQNSGGRRTTIEGHIRAVDDALRGGA